MAFRVNQFQSHFAKHRDYAKTSKFDVIIYKPSGLVTQTTDLRFQCETAELPGLNINTVDGRYYGVPQSVASVGTFNDITLSFICAADLWEKKLFDQWMNLILGRPSTSYLLSYKNEYSTKIDINQYYEDAPDSGVGAAASAAPEKSYIVSLHNAFPISMSPLQLNWADDNIHRLSVTFKYDYWDTRGTVANDSLRSYGDQLDASIRDKVGKSTPNIDYRPPSLDLQLPNKPATGPITRSRRTVGPI